MEQFKERRQHIRRMGEGMAVLIDGRAYPVVDISVSGVSFQASGHRPGNRVKVTLAILSRMEDQVEAVIDIRGASDSVLRAEFQPTARLMRYIIAHLSSITGSQPAYFR